MDKETLEKLYLKSGADLVAEKLDCSIPIVYRLLKEANIKLDGRKRNSGRKKKFQLEK